MKFKKLHQFFHKDVSKTSAIVAVATQVVRQSLMKTLVFSIVLLTIIMVFLLKTVIFPLYNELKNLEIQTRNSLLSRNQEMMRSAVELGSSNIGQLLISTELAVNNIIADIYSPKLKIPETLVFPLEKEFYQDGAVKKTLENHPFYFNQPVSFVYPHIYYPDDQIFSDVHLSELLGLKAYWYSFQQTANKILSYNLELKWLYIATSTGMFLGYPGGPGMPKGYDPRSRSWYKVALESKMGSWSVPYYTPGGNDMMLTFSKKLGPHPFLKDAVVGADLVLKDMITHVLSTPLCDKCQLYLVNDKNEIIAGKNFASIEGSWDHPLQIQTIDSVLGEHFNNETGRKYLKESLARILNDNSNHHLPTSRYPVAKKIKLTSNSDKEENSHTIYSTNIERLNWHLVGIIINDSIGNNGEKILSEISIYSRNNRIGFISVVLTVLIGMFLLAGILYLTFKKTMHKRMQPALVQFKNLANDLDAIQSDNIRDLLLKISIDTKDSITHEHKIVVDALRRLSEKLVVAEKKLEEKTRLEAIGETTRQVVHDIRSPLAALRVVTNIVKDLPEDHRILIRSAVQRIDDITNELAGKNVKKLQGAENQEVLKENLIIQLLSSLIESLISEKRVQFRAHLNLKIESKLSAISYGLFAKIQPVEFKRVLSNLINNAVEAMECEGEVIVSLLVGSKGDTVQIAVSDNGKGIPAEILPQLMQQGATFGKEKSGTSGSGLGLYHARECMRSWRGDIEIKSEVDKGTEVILTLPKKDPPSWFVPELNISVQTQVVILDDDSSIHYIWDSRFTAIKFEKRNIFHFTTAEDVKKWFESVNHRRDILFLFDYELIGSEKTGLNIIEELGIMQSSILVTSRYEDETIRKNCDRLSVKLIPKSLAGFVPIHFQTIPSHVEYILIDDDSVTRKNWRLSADIHKKSLVTFSTASEFFNNVNSLNRDALLYIDSNLDHGVKGEMIAKEIRKKGFDRIFLATGSNPDEFNAMSWIEGVVDKVPPWLN